MAKRILIPLLMLGVLLCGCGVSMNAAYRKELNQQVELVKVAANAAEAGKLTPEQQTAVIERIYVLLRTWQDAQSLKGVPSDPAERAAYIAGIYKELDE